MPLQPHPAIAMHPGQFLRAEIVEPMGWNVTRLAGHFGVTRQALSAVLSTKARLSAEMAIRFEQAFGIRADTMLRMQVAHDLARARSAGAIHIGPMR